MQIKQIASILDAKVLGGTDFMERDIEACCGSDLMSDVLAHSRRNSLLLTGLTNLQVIRTADVSELGGIVLVRGKKPTLDFILEAEQEGLPVLATDYSMFEACGLLYQHGLKGCIKQLEEKEAAQ